MLFNGNTKPISFWFINGAPEVWHTYVTKLQINIITLSKFRVFSPCPDAFLCPMVSDYNRQHYSQGHKIVGPNFLAE
jgi:hypothetical protein